MSLVHSYMRITGKLVFTLLFAVAVNAYGQSMSQSSVNQEAEENLAQLRIHAESGDANAQYDLAWMYDTGGDNKILAKDTRKAAEWYEKALAGSFGIPLLSRYSQPRFNCASAFPCADAFCSQSTPLT